MKMQEWPSYREEVEALSRAVHDVEVYKGLEVDFIPGVVSPAEFSDQLDYTIGSIHFVDAYSDGRPWEIDGPHAAFLHGLEAIFRNDIRAVVARYFELTCQMITTACPDIVGHLDKIKIQNTGDKFYKESETWYQEELIRALRLIKEAGAILEVNTRGLYQKKSPTPYPSPWILEIAKKLDIPVVLSSDAHHPDDIFNTFSETAALLLSLGFTQLTTRSEGAWHQVDFTQNGIQLEHHRS